MYYIQCSKNRFREKTDDLILVKLAVFRRDFGSRQAKMILMDYWHSNTPNFGDFVFPLELQLSAIKYVNFQFVVIFPQTSISP